MAPRTQRTTDHTAGTEDEPLPAEPPPDDRARSSWWLPRGHHYDLHVEHRSLEHAGPFTGGGNKLVWHITASGWMTADAVWRVVRDNRSAPHLIIGGRAGRRHPVVIQCIPFNRAARALRHPSGPDTNRADCLQVEVCADVDDVPAFPRFRRYQALANLVRLTNLTVPDDREVSRRLARAFTDRRRFGGQEFVRAAGHCGHMHVPGNDHTDPTTAFDGPVLLRRLEAMPAGGYDL
jgi:hypothetical protein